MTKPIPNKDEQEVLNQMNLAIQQYVVVHALFATLETRLRALSRDPVKNPIAPTLLQHLAAARFTMKNGPVHGTA